MAYLHGFKEVVTGVWLSNLDLYNLMLYPVGVINYKEDTSICRLRVAFNPSVDGSIAQVFAATIFACIVGLPFFLAWHHEMP